MFRLAVAASIVACCLASLLEWHDFRTFQTQFNKHYKTDEENIRFEIYSRNLEIIRTHNNEADQGLHTYRLGVNEYADMTNEEFQRVMLGFRYDPNTPVQDDVFKASVNADDLPDTVDWRTKGYVTPVKNQGQCGSCWAFSTTGSLEGQHFKATGKLVSLSEQNLVDCSKKEGNMGCMGGLMDQGFRYIKKNHGIDTEASYPYKGKNEKCHFKKVDVGANLTSFKDIKKGDEKALQQAVAEIGPISVAIDAGHPSFQLYKSGVYSERKCSSKKLDHGVLAVGYGTESGAEYWLVKNSWGPSWGQEGYIMMSRNKDNQCGIATQASYPIVAKRGQ